MQHVAAVGQLHRPRQRLHQLRRLPCRQRLVVELPGEVAAFDELQGAVRMPARLADLVNLHDVGVLQPRHRLGLDAETGQLTRRGMVAGQHHLERHGALQRLVARFVDNTHAAAAEDGLDRVAGDGRQRQLRWSRREAVA